MENAFEGIYEVTEVSRIYDESGKNYPSYRISRECIGLYRSLEDAAELVRRRAEGGYCVHDETVLYSIRLMPLDCPFDGYMAMEEYLYDGSGKLLDKRTEPFSCSCFPGRDPEECRFRAGDLCEVLKGDEMVLGIVAATPFTREEMEMRRERGLANHFNDRDVCQVLLLVPGKQYLHRPVRVDILSLVRPRYRVHPATARKLRRLRDEHRTAPVRHAIETAAREARLRSVLEDIGLEPVSISRPEYPLGDFLLHFRPGELKDLVPDSDTEEVVIQIVPNTVDRHLDELRVGLSRLTDSPVPGRGLRLKRDRERPDWLYYF